MSVSFLNSTWAYRKANIQDTGVWKILEYRVGAHFLSENNTRLGTGIWISNADAVPGHV